MCIENEQQTLSCWIICFKFCIRNWHEFRQQDYSIWVWVCMDGWYMWEIMHTPCSHDCRWSWEDYSKDSNNVGHKKSCLITNLLKLMIVLNVIVLSEIWSYNIYLYQNLSVDYTLYYDLPSCVGSVGIPGGPKKRGHSTFSQISRKLLKICKWFFLHTSRQVYAEHVIFTRILVIHFIQCPIAGDANGH